MQLDLTRYRQALSHFTRVFQPEDVQQDGDAYKIVAPVRVDFDIHKDKARFRLVGTVQTELELACGRCLEPFRIPIDSEFDMRYLPESESSGEGEREVTEDDQIDLNEVLREQFYLALPMKPLCREDCGGLCPQCGTNRNTGTCTCVTDWVDPRLAPLKRLTHAKSKT
jgi:uncharacterized protein